MTTTLILQIDDTSKIDQILNLAKRLKVPFRFDTTPNIPAETDDSVVWNWEDCDNAAYELSLETFAEDWNSEADKVWDTV